MRVFVLDKYKQPLDPCHPARARELLTKRRAKVFKRYPFTIIMQDRLVEDSKVHPHLDRTAMNTKSSNLRYSLRSYCLLAEIPHPLKLKFITGVPFPHF